LIYQTRLFICRIKNVGLMNQAPTQDQSSPCREIKRLQRNQAPAEEIKRLQMNQPQEATCKR